MMTFMIIVFLLVVVQTDCMSCIWMIPTSIGDSTRLTADYLNGSTAVFAKTLRHRVVRMRTINCERMQR